MQIWHTSTCRNILHTFMPSHCRINWLQGPRRNHLHLISPCIPNAHMHWLSNKNITTWYQATHSSAGKSMMRFCQAFRQDSELVHGSLQGDSALFGCSSSREHGSPLSPKLFFQQLRGFYLAASSLLAVTINICVHWRI